MFKSLEKLKKSGFEGFKSIKELSSNIHLIPNQPGVYMILDTTGLDPKFLTIGTGGYFQNKNPNKDLNYLITKWVKETHLVYVGKAGGDNNSTLRSRLKLYFEFGNGKPVGHYGGRLIWQLKNSSELIVCWKEIKDNNPREIEKQFISDFKIQFGHRPFANING